MFVLHALWLADSRLGIWAEDGSRPATAPPRRGRPPRLPRPRPHPFASGTDELIELLGAFNDGHRDPSHRSAAQPTELTLHLPSAPNAPAPSPHLLRIEEDDRIVPTGFAPWTVPVLTLAPSRALDLLLADPATTNSTVTLTTGPGAAHGNPPTRVRLADSFGFWGAVARLALELVAAGRVVPTILHRDRATLAVWRPAPRAAEDERLEHLAATIPASCLAIWQGRDPSQNQHQSTTTPVDDDELPPTPRALIESSLNAFVDSCARDALDDHPLLRARGTRTGGNGQDGRDGRNGTGRPGAEAWLAALVAPDPVVHAEPTELKKLREVVAEWASAAVPTHAAALRTCFRLTPPASSEPASLEPGSPEPRSPERGSSEPDNPWRLEFLLQATDDRSLVVPAADVWKTRARSLEVLRRHLDDPQEHLLADLGRALRLYPELAPALRTAAPTGLDLDTVGAHHFLREAAPLLEGAGFGVVVPSWWTRPAARLGLRLRAEPRPRKKTS